MENSKIQEKIESYKHQREALVKQANEQIIALNGAIQALEDLLKEEVSSNGNTRE